MLGATDVIASACDAVRMPSDAFRRTVHTVRRRIATFHLLSLAAELPDDHGPRPMKCALLLVGFAALGCGSVSSADPAPDSAPVHEVGVDVGADTGAPAEAGDAAEVGDTAVAPYPAFAPNPPQVQKGAGSVAAATKIVTITFPGDPNAAKYESFGDGLGGSDYWKKVTGEYGVGTAMGGGHVRLADPMSTPLADSESLHEVNAWLDTFFAAADKNGLPAYDAANLYVIYVDPKAALSYYGHPWCDANRNRWAYESVRSVGGVEYSYILVGQCDWGRGVLDTTTANVSELIAAAAINPPVPLDAKGARTKPDAWYGLDSDHYADAVFHVGRVGAGTLCQHYPEAFVKSAEPAFPYAVLRGWSNASAAAGHHPCVPDATVPYFDVVPLGTETVTVNDGVTSTTVKGFAVALGGTKTFQVGFFSDAKTDPWTLTTTEKDQLDLLGYSTWPPTNNLQVTIDRTTGKNGDVATVKVKVLSYGRPTTPTPALLTFISTLGGESHYRSVLFVPPT